MADSSVPLGRYFGETPIKAVDIGGGLYALAAQLIAGGAVAPYGWNYSPGAGDGVTAGGYIGLPVNAAGLRFNGSTWDRERGNVGSTLLASAARTAQTTSPVQTAYNSRGVLVFVNVTAVPGAGGITPIIQGVDPVSGATVNILTAAAALTAIGLYTYALFPGGPAPAAALGGFTLAQNGILPRSWQLRVNVATADSYTYSAGAVEVV